MRIMAREILTKEVGLKFSRSRFEWQGKLYPLHLVVFEDQKKLGDYDHSQWRIGLSKRLMREAKDAVIRDVLRHEIAHLITHLLHGAEIFPHGPEFQEVCARYNWPKEVSSAALDLNSANENYTGDLVGEKLLIRLKKLMALAESSNPHEAEVATTKANELLVRHNLERIDLEQMEEVYVLPVLFAARTNSKMHAIYEILKTFFVAPVFTKRQGKIALDVVGDLTSVQFAHYVAGFLDAEFERLWLVAKNKQKLKGMVAKNSFYAGIGRGYVAKIKDAQKVFETKQIVRAEHASLMMLKRVYGRLSSTQSHSKTDATALNAGNQAGQKLTIRSAVERQASAGYLLSYDT